MTDLSPTRTETFSVSEEQHPKSLTESDQFATKKEKKKRKREVEGTSEKKRAKKQAKSEDYSTPDITNSSSLPTKKRKNRTGFLDPNKDTSLSDQSRKCWPLIMISI